MQPIKILLFSAYPLWAQSLGTTLESLSRKSTVTIVIPQGDLNTEIEGILAIDLDLILISLGTPIGDLAFARSLRVAECPAAILLLCSHYLLPCLEELVESGIQGLVSSLADVEELEAAIYTIIDGQPATLEHQYQQAIQKLPRLLVQKNLKKRQIEILELVALDLTNQEIAERLQIEVSTVNNHLNRIYDRLGVRGRGGVVLRAITDGLINPHTLSLSPDFSGSKKYIR